MPLKKNPVTLHIYVPLHFYGGLHIDPTVLYIQVQIKQQSSTGTPNIFARYVPDTNMLLECNIYTRYAN